MQESSDTHLALKGEGGEGDYYVQRLIQAVFDIGTPILGTLVWACPNLILSKSKTTSKHNSSHIKNISRTLYEHNNKKK